MKKIINGKMYNTETAKDLGTAWSKYAANDFKWWMETLYLKKTGEYFLYGEGGPMTQYAERCSDGYRGGSDITPLTEGQAKEWVEKHLEVDEYEKIFGSVEE